MDLFAVQLSEDQIPDASVGLPPRDQEEGLYPSRREKDIEACLMIRAGYART